MTENFSDLMVKDSIEVLRGSRFECLLLHFVQNLNKRLMVYNKNINKNIINSDNNNKFFYIYFILFYYERGPALVSFFHFCVGQTHIEPLLFVSSSWSMLISSYFQDFSIHCLTQ